MLCNQSINTLHQTFDYRIFSGIVFISYAFRRTGFMNKIILFLFALILCSSVVYAQKGVDPQSRKIHEEGVRGTAVTSNNGDPFDFGKGKTKTREMLANPYRLAARRNVLVENVINVLKERKLIIDENASRLSEGFIVTEPYIFAKGAVTTRSELSRYAVLPTEDAVFTRGRYILTIEVQSIDGVQNNVSVTAKVDGKSENGLSSEWTTLASTGVAEDEFLAKLIEAVTGVSPDPVQGQ